jgi:twitching motility protein PilT
VRNLIREGKVPQISSMMQMGAKIGMQTMRDTLNRLFSEGIISTETLRDALATGTTEAESDDTKTGSGENPSTARRRSFGNESAF